MGTIINLLFTAFSPDATRLLAHTRSALPHAPGPGWFLRHAEATSAASSSVQILKQQAPRQCGAARMTKTQEEGLGGEKGTPLPD